MMPDFLRKIPHENKISYLLLLIIFSIPAVVNLFHYGLHGDTLEPFMQLFVMLMNCGPFLLPNKKLHKSAAVGSALFSMIVLFIMQAYIHNLPDKTGFSFFSLFFIMLYLFVGGIVVFVLNISAALLAPEYAKKSWKNSAFYAIFITIISLSFLIGSLFILLS